jgi:hypothetical protein
MLHRDEEEGGRPRVLCHPGRVVGSFKEAKISGELLREVSAVCTERSVTLLTMGSQRQRSSARWLAGGPANRCEVRANEWLLGGAMMSVQPCERELGHASEKARPART